MLHSQQGLAIRPTVSDPSANLTLMQKKRRALHEKRRKPRQSDIPHRKLQVLPAPLVRQARAGPSDTLDQIIEKPHRIVESELDPKHKRLFRKIGAIAKMRIAASLLAVLTACSSGVRFRVGGNGARDRAGIPASPWPRHTDA